MKLVLFVAFFLFSASAYSSVGSVDHPRAQKAAACEYASENAGTKSAGEREVSAYNLVQNFSTIVEKKRSSSPKKRKTRRGRTQTVN